MGENNIEKPVARLSLVLKLFQKYRVKMFAASFASSVFDMRQMRDASAFLELLGLRQEERLLCNARLHDFLEEQ